MATIKSYTDLKQSKVLSKILKLESANMHILIHEDLSKSDYGFSKETQDFYSKTKFEYLPCWSLAALLDVLPDGTDITKGKADTENEKYMCTAGVKDDIISTFGNNPIDACVAMIEKLNETKMLVL